MAAEWKGRRDVDLIREPRAANTAENAVRSLQLLETIEGGSEVIAVCSISHYPRVRFFFDRLYKRHGYSVGYRYVASPIPSPRLILAELSSITRMARDRRRALRLLNRDGLDTRDGIHGPDVGTCRALALASDVGQALSLGVENDGDDDDKNDPEHAGPPAGTV